VKYKSAFAARPRMRERGVTQVSVNQTMRVAGRLMLILALLSQTIFVGGVASAAQKRKAKKKKATAEKRTAVLPQIVLPGAQTPVQRSSKTGAAVNQTGAPMNQPAAPVKQTSATAPVSLPSLEAQTPAGITGERGVAVSAVVDVSTIAAEDSLAPESSNNEPKVIHPPLSPPTEGQPIGGKGLASPNKGRPVTGIPNADTQPGPLVPSPGPSDNFQGLVDNQQFIPPDTMGAVGLSHVVTTLNDRMRIQDRAGTIISTVSTDSFWAPLASALGYNLATFDPKISYDRHTNRWIYTITANGQSPNSALLVAVSQSSDPTQYWTLFGVDTDAAGTIWADYPSVGFNQNWIAVQLNMFTVAANAFVRPDIYVFNKAQAVANTAPNPSIGFTKFTGNNTGSPSAITGSTWAPSIDADNASPNKLWFVQTWNSTSGLIRVSTLTGSVGSEVITPGTQFPGSPESWFSGQVLLSGGWAPQANDTKTAPFSTYISANDSRMLNAVYRRVNGLDRLWSAHTVFEQTVHSAAGTSANSVANPVNHSAIQWWQLDATLEPGAFITAPVQRALIEDLAANNCHNGSGGLTGGCVPTGTFYAFPSIAVNNAEDALLGFSRYNALDWVGAAYAYRDHTDALNTFRDPLVYKVTTLAEGTGRYSKSGNGNVRWGDYSASHIDPRNDHHFWTIQEYAAPRINSGGTSVWATWWARVAALTPAPALPGQLIIKEFRESGPAGANDEFIEVYNNSLDPMTVQSIDVAGIGYAIVASDGVTRCTIPNGTVIPVRGHYLCANSSAGGYSLGGYPAGTGTATPDATYTLNIPDDAGIAVFRTTVAANFNTANRLDAVGSTAEANTLYKEGTGYPAMGGPVALEYSFVRDMCGKHGSTSATGPCVQSGNPRDTDNNANDFFFIDTVGTVTPAGQRLGAPGPENLAAPIQRNSLIGTLLDTSVGSGSSPNRVRDLTPGPAATSTQGTLDIRRTITNNTGGNITRLRFRIIDFSTFLAPGGADLRAITSTDVLVSTTCCGNVQVRGTTLEQPPTQAGGGGFNSSLSAGIITLANPLPNNTSISVRFLLGVQQTGRFKFIVNIEALP
jgi:hypothetical protein